MGSIKNEWGNISDCFNDEHELVNFIFERFDSSGFEISYRDMGGFNEPNEMFKVTVQDKIDSLQEYLNEIIEEKDKLQKENKELKSRLEKSVELPCKAGDTVYFKVKGYDPWYTYQNFIQKQEITMIILRNDFIQFQTASKTYYLEDFGKTVFLTKEEAEQVLKGSADDE